jgi:Na+-transporting methylmalonyl-CoA/oxaloacetate decarboxylase gamma subunit
MSDVMQILIILIVVAGGIGLAVSDGIKERKRRESMNANLLKKFRMEKKQKKEDEKVKAAEEKLATKAIQKQMLAQEKLDSILLNLNNSLPFYTNNKSDEFSSENGDDSRWHYVVEAVKSNDIENTELYLVKVKSLNNNEEYYKIGVTTQSISDRFLRSPDVELVGIIASHRMDKRLALFAEFHFIREFRPSNKPDEEIRFSGSTEIVKSNSIKKIRSLMSRLSEYEAKASGFLGKSLSVKAGKKAGK